MYLKALYLSNICNATSNRLEQHLWPRPMPIASPNEWPISPKPMSSEWQFGNGLYKQHCLVENSWFFPSFGTVEALQPTLGRCGTITPAKQHSTGKQTQVGPDMVSLLATLKPRLSTVRPNSRYLTRWKQVSGFIHGGARTETISNRAGSYGRSHCSGFPCMARQTLALWICNELAADSKHVKVWGPDLRGYGSWQGTGNLQWVIPAQPWGLHLDHWRSDSHDHIIGSMITPGITGNHHFLQWGSRSIWASSHAMAFPQGHAIGTRQYHSGLWWPVLDWLQSHKVIDPFEVHSDLLQACQHVIAASLVKSTYNMSRGYQNDGTPTVLSHEAWLNIEVDLLAKNKTTLTHKTTTSYCLLFEPWSLHVRSKKFVKHHKQELRLAYNRWPAQQYWRTEFPTLDSSLRELDIQVMEWAMSESTPAKCCWVIKHITRQFVHKKNMVQQGLQSSANCPHCQADQEDKLVPSAYQQWTTS